jgi:hypothetical protein
MYNCQFFGLIYFPVHECVKVAQEQSKNSAVEKQNRQKTLRRKSKRRNSEIKKKKIEKTTKTDCKRGRRIEDKLMKEWKRYAAVVDGFP